jgi:hypothetical protein
MSFYLKFTQRFPQYHELLICQATTTDEDIELFFQRAAHPFAQPPEPYAVVYPEKLHPSKQALVRKLVVAIAGNSTLVILVSSHTSSFYNIVPRHILLSPLSHSLLHRLIVQHMAGCKLTVKVVTSEYSGGQNRLH